MEWNHISEKQPKDGEVIVQIFPKCKEHHCIGQVIYKQYCTFDEWINFNRKNGLKEPDFWWISANDFPFPDQPERLSEKTSKEDAIV